MLVLPEAAFREGAVKQGGNTDFLRPCALTHEDGFSFIREMEG